MGKKSEKAGSSAAHPTLGEPEFSAHFSQSRRLLWLIAAGILGDRTLAEDVVQDAALIALSKLDQFTPGTSFNAWMAQMVRHVAMNTLRRENRRRGTSLPPESDGGLHDGAFAAHAAPRERLSTTGELPAEQSWFDDQLMRALREVGDTARACLLLRTIESLEYSEISSILAIPEGTAMSHVHRTRRFLRERLADRPRPSAHVSGGNA